MLPAEDLSVRDNECRRSGENILDNSRRFGWRSRSRGTTGTCTSSAYNNLIEIFKLLSLLLLLSKGMGWGRNNINTLCDKDRETDPETERNMQTEAETNKETDGQID